MFLYMSVRYVVIFLNETLEWKVSREQVREPQGSHRLSRCYKIGRLSEPLVFLLSANCNHINHVAAFELLNIIQTFMFTICLNGASTLR